MKKHWLILGFLALTTVLFGQNSEAILQGISKSNIDLLASHMDESVELCILGEPDLVDREVAIDRIKKFVRDVSPSAYNSMHEGSSKRKGSKYAIANLQTQKGIFRVFLFFEKVNGKSLVREIRFDSE